MRKTFAKPLLDSAGYKEIFLNDIAKVVALEGILIQANIHHRKIDRGRLLGGSGTSFFVKEADHPTVRELIEHYKDIFYKRTI